ncbi:hypothetical protein [Acidithiobacillus thiooxidans]|uniref:Uncharacterized protein n=1 Tax=Acidithiobacillus thiooxidans TaxID=930 RepID=A0A1C2IY89_ACITH|nr:hypothetical protein [Acidithiobacillus thiooxidans]OCX67884.1 hypothetical protein A6M23_19755 [Acidithiobacillus thiooxidans]OCX80995.1 hypothetical protein A6P08_14955 [Acidithiobacillus thiooxidans]
MHLFLTKEELRKSGKVFCEDCQHFESGSTPGGLGFCALTKNRQARVEETGKTVSDRQGLPPDTTPELGCAACYPMAPRVCGKFRERSAAAAL